MTTQAEDGVACGACGSALGRLCDQLAPELGVEPAAVQSKLEALKETNPMLGLRGCRLGVLYPDITRMQVPPPRPRLHDNSGTIAPCVPSRRYRAAWTTACWDSTVGSLLTG